MDAYNVVKLFRLSHEMLERDLDQIETRHELDLGRRQASPAERDNEYYPQFDQAVRDEAEAMAAHYELFYCLERSLRELIQDTMESVHGPAWWNSAVPEGVRVEAEKNMKIETDSAVTPRSADEIDYTTFGQLGDIVKSNWETFGSIFGTQRGFNKVMASLNVLRGPIAHCCPLAPDEVVRLRLTVADYFRLMS